MDGKTTFVKTSKGEEETRSNSARLSGDIKRTLLMVDGESTFGDLSKRAAPSLRNSLEQMLNELVRDGFIQEVSQTGSAPRMAVAPKMVVPAKMVTPVKKPPEDEGVNELDFATGFKPQSTQERAVEAVNTEAEAVAYAIAEANAIKANQEAESKARAQAEAQARAMTEAKAKQDAGARARAEAEERAAIEIQARALDEARARAEAQARGVVEAKANPEAEALARINAAAEAQERAIAAAKAKLEADAKAIAAAKAKLEVEAKAIAEAQAKARAVAEEKARLEAEAKARLEREAKARQELEASKLTAVPDEAIFQSVLKSAQASPDSAEVKLEPFTFIIPNPELLSPEAAAYRTHPNLRKDEAALVSDIGKIVQPRESKKTTPATPASMSKPQAATPAPAPPSPSVQTPPSPPVQVPVPEAAKPREAVQPAAEVRKPHADEVKKLEDAQAKIWAEAEQRAKAAAKAKAMWDVSATPEPAAPAKKITPVVRVKRKPFPWLKLSAGLVVLLLIALFVAPLVIPTRQYVPGIENLLSAKFQQPVHIGQLEGRLLPKPRLDLIDLSIGGKNQIKVQHAKVNFSAPALLTAIRTISSVELEGVAVDGASLQKVSEWMQQIAEAQDFPIERILLKDGKLDAEGITLSGIGGEMNFDQFGKFSNAKLHAEGSKYALAMEAIPGNKASVSISVNGRALPLLPNWDFDYLIAKGILTADELAITELDGHIHGGTLLVNARINWRSGWRAEGSIEAKEIEMQKMFQALSGSMNGTASFRMQARNLAQLPDMAVLDGSYVLDDGVIVGIDIVETARLRSAQHMPGGRTHFQKLSGELSYANNTYAFRQMKMNSDVMTAYGSLEYSGQQLSGSITADVAVRDEMAHIPMQLAGTKDNPTLHSLR